MQRLLKNLSSPLPVHTSTAPAGSEQTEHTHFPLVVDKAIHTAIHGTSYEETRGFENHLHHLTLFGTSLKN